MDSPALAAAVYSLTQVGRIRFPQEIKYFEEENDGTKPARLNADIERRLWLAASANHNVAHSTPREKPEACPPCLAPQSGL